jgi:hypothetical protein
LEDAVKRYVVYLFIALAVVLFAATAVGALDRDDPQRNVGRYDLKAERTFEGTIAGKGHVIEGLVYFPFKTTDSVLEVQAGPREFLAHGAFKVNPGEMVTVIGVPVVMNERQVVLAREIRTMNGDFIVRDDDGTPLWETDHPMRMDPERHMRPEEVCEMFPRRMR